MLIKKFSNKINGYGCIAVPGKVNNLLDLNHSKISNIFKKKGFILFRNFKFRKEKITLSLTSLLKNMQMMLIEI